MFILSKVMLFRLLLLSLFTILRCTAWSWPWSHKEKTKLLLVQTIFRHGDRAPIILYPTDPNGLDNWPNGLGQLTQLGKKQHYEVGKYLRSMYKDFVNSDPNEIYVNSSSEDRCLNSAESNLASFYAPTWKWIFEFLVFWQPIAVHYLPPEMDIYLDMKINCHKSDIAVKKSLKSSKIQQFYKAHQEMVKEVTKSSGINMSNPKEAVVLYDTLLVEKIHKLEIPKWAKTYWDEMHALSVEVYHAFFSSPVQLRLRIGPFLGLLTENLQKKINGSHPDRKFIHNSSHDLNVLGILMALNFTDMPPPPYCATLIFELHEMSDDSKAVRLLYMNSTDPASHVDEPQVLVLEGCKEFCPVEDFMKSYQHLIPNNWKAECEVET